MIARQVVVGVGLLVFSLGSYACRCQQQALDDYFGQSDWVWMSVLLDYQVLGSDVDLVFAPSQRFYKSLENPPSAVVTGQSSAQCGLPLEKGQLYILFAQDDPQRPGHARVHTCNGSRLLAGGGAGQDVFRGIPLKFLASQLDALAGVELLAAIAHSEPHLDAAENDTLVGLLALPDSPLSVYTLPGQDSPAGKVRLQQLATLELAYEQPAAVVYAARPPWFKVKIVDGDFRWLTAKSNDFYPYDDLPINRLGYLKGSWSGYLWPEIGAGLPYKASTDGMTWQEHAVEVVKSQRIGNSLWFYITLYDENPCERASARRGASGWVPGYDRRGEPVVWFYSRGC